jgi:hypothetical protein
MPKAAKQSQDPLPLIPDRFYRKSVVAENKYFGCGITALEDMIRDKKIAPPVRIGRRMVGWFGRYLIQAQRELEQSTQRKSA